MNEQDKKDLHDQLEAWSEIEKTAVDVAKMVSAFRNELIRNGMENHEALAISAVFLQLSFMNK